MRVDCREKRQPLGTRAKDYTSELAFGQDVTVYGDKRDPMGDGWPKSSCRMVGASIKNCSRQDWRGCFGSIGI